MELKRLLRGLNIEVVGLCESDSTQEIEAGLTFADNALMKARCYHRRFGMPTISDDSGLEVDSLDGRPGIHSARLGGAKANDGQRVAVLLEQMRHVPRRAAKFTCAAGFVWD